MIRTRFAVLLAFAVLSAPTMAQHANHGAPAEAPAFPEACRTAAAPKGGTAHDHAGQAMQEHQRASMEGMKRMDAEMMQGMMQDDADVAFVCGMIAHHRGAIDMARVELEHGKDAWARELAGKIIDAQTAEIAEMTEWLARAGR